MIDLFGQPLVPVPRSRSRENKRAVRSAKAKTLSGTLARLAKRYALIAAANGLPMPAIFGRKSGGLQPSADLDTFLVSRLQALKGLNGSLEYEVAWKSSAMLLGLPIYRLRASERHRLDRDSSGWPTPDTGMGPHGQRGVSLNLKNQSSHCLLAKAHLAGWATPRVTTNGGHGSPERAADGKSRLEDQIHGTTASSSSVQTENRGQLSPDFTRWLMGFPPEHLSCAPTGTR